MRQRVQIVLVPFDEVAVFHRGRADGHDAVQKILGQDKTADMLGEVAGKTDQLRWRNARPARSRHWRGRSRPGAPGSSLRFVAMMAPDTVGQLAGDIFGEAENLADFADGAARTIADHRGGERGAAMAIASDRYTG